MFNSKNFKDMNEKISRVYLLDILKNYGEVVFNIARSLQAQKCNCSVADVTELPEETLKEAKKLRDSHNPNYKEEHPSVYAGTYGKYNDGSIFGDWIALDTFEDYREFRNYVDMIHSDEYDVEPMYQDFENFPRLFYSESMGKASFDRIIEWAKLSEEDQEMLDAYISVTCNENATIDEARDAFEGKFDSEYEFGEYCADNFYEIPKSLTNYIDYEKMGREIAWDYDVFDDYYFRKS